MIIWTAGIKGNVIKGLKPESYTRNGRLIVDTYNRIKEYENIYALGDIAFMAEWKISQRSSTGCTGCNTAGKTIVGNLKRISLNKPLKEFRYRDLGTMATIGKNLAVVELPLFNFQGIFGWFVWMFIHLMSIVGVKNKLVIFINWAWKYFTYDQSTRLILRPKGKS